MIEKIVADKLAEQSNNQRVQEFYAAKDDAGNPRYPHVDKVADTMTQLLGAKLAKDLPDAYEAALRLPQHAELYAETERLQREATEKAAAEERAKQAGRARRNAISTPGSTPTSVATAADGKKGLRAQLEENFDTVTASRV